MRVTVQYLAQLKRASGCATEAVEPADGATLRDVLRLLGDRHDAAFRHLLLDESTEPRKSLLIFVGDEHADLDRRLNDGDAVTILTPMSGG